MTPLCTNIGEPFLKDRILRLWNLTVSSDTATITTQSLKGEGGTFIMELGILPSIYRLQANHLVNSPLMKGVNRVRL